MVTVSDSIEFYINELTQEAYDKVISKIDFKEMRCNCGIKGSFVKIGYYNKNYKTSEKRINIQIQRIKCKHCGRTHAVFIDKMVPSSMLLVSTQIKLLKSYYDYSISGFLENYVSIDLPNIYYVVRNYEKKWRYKLESANLSLNSDEKELVNYFLENDNTQFMQMKRHENFYK